MQLRQASGAATLDIYHHSSTSTRSGVVLIMRARHNWIHCAGLLLYAKGPTATNQGGGEEELQLRWSGGTQWGRRKHKLNQNKEKNPAGKELQRADGGSSPARDVGRMFAIIGLNGPMHILPQSAAFPISPPPLYLPRRIHTKHLSHLNAYVFLLN